MKRYLLAVLVTAALTLSSALAAPLRLIQTSPTKRQWLSEEQIQMLSDQQHQKGRCGGFMDVTDTYAAYQKLGPAQTFRPVELLLGPGPLPMYRSLVNQMMPRLDAKKLESHVRTLSTEFRNRYFQSETGVQAAHWIRDQFIEIATQYGRRDVQVELFKHRFAQPSIIARIPGRGVNSRELVVLGAHEDSIQQFSTSHFMLAPGADDDASGIASLLEVFRVLMETGFYPNRTIEFIAYAGEEKGLLGSQDIALKYRRDGKRVAGVLQFDMVGFPGSGDKMVMIRDHADSALSDFVEVLIKEYLKVTVLPDDCGYACSDHASWTDAGYPSAFPFESRFAEYNQQIHTPNDLIERVDFGHVERFAKLGVAFAVELGKASH